MSKTISCVFGLTLACAVICQFAQSVPSVTVTEGRLRGSWVTTRQGRRIAAFKGIPYAAPPTGELRFQSPQPVEPWPGIKHVTVDRNMCVQFSYLLGIQGEEDCLYLNIYTPQISESRLLPVLFYIHGGAFKAGSSDSFLYGPKYLLDEEIVLVTINYRLGLFGFLSLGDAVLPGNLGLKDQLAALRWVHKNIAQFGGDPEAITLFGESAGAASVHYHMMFKADEGLFRAGICHSGSALMGGGLQRPADQKPLIHHLAAESGCLTPEESNSADFLHCLRMIRPYRLLRMAVRFYPPFDSLKKNIELSPVVESSCVEDAFITSDPWNKNTSLPMIMGTNKFEGLFIIVDLLKDWTNQKFQEYNKAWETIIPYNMMFEKTAKDPIQVARSLKEFYLKNNDLNRKNVLQLVDLISDGIFNYPESIAVQNNLAKTYMYSFEYHGTKSILNILGVDNIYGPTHVDELFLYFPFPLISAQRFSNKSEEDKQLSHQLIKIWTHFATHLEPSGEGVTWDPVSSPDLEHLIIGGAGNLTMASRFLPERMLFWDQLAFRDIPFPQGMLDCPKQFIKLD